MLSSGWIVAVGWAAGILVNYLADVLPVQRRLGHPACSACFRPFDFGNYLIWPRRCPHCGARRAFRTWAVEICLAGISLWFWLHPPAFLPFILILVLVVYFAVVVVIDLEHKLILHPVSLVGIGLGLAFGSRLHGAWNALAGGAAGFAAMSALYLFGALLLKGVRRWQSEPGEEALGFGDVALSGVLGLILGWPGITLGLGLAIVLGGLGSLAWLILMVLLRRYRPNLAIPYGPFLVAGAVILLFFPQLLQR